MKHVTLALAACAPIAYGKTPMKRNFTDLACLLLATNVFSRPENRYRTSRLKVLIKYYSALLISLYWLSPTREFVSFLPNAIQLSNIVSCSPAGPHHSGWLSKIKLLKVQKQYPVLSCQYPSKCFPTSSRFPACLFRFGSPQPRFIPGRATHQNWVLSTRY